VKVFMAASRPTLLILRVSDTDLLSFIPSMATGGGGGLLEAKRGGGAYIIWTLQDLLALIMRQWLVRHTLTINQPILKMIPLKKT
jgi:hypothetical protein